MANGPHIGHTRVVKNVGQVPSPAACAPRAAAAAMHPADGRTRQAVARLLLEQGPTTAASIADALKLSPAAVRRHLDALLADGEVGTRDAPRRGHRGRGRPAKLFLLTEAGRARFGHAYDDLAVALLRFLAARDGDESVRDFARSRVASLVDPHKADVVAKADVVDRTRVLAAALSREGYAAATRHVASGEQLCQHHCPVAHVAAEFPQLCEAETEAFAKVLGTHVQRLATIARGDAACTTHVPTVVPTARLPRDASTNTGEVTSTDRDRAAPSIPHGGKRA